MWLAGPAAALLPSATHSLPPSALPCAPALTAYSPQAGLLLAPLGALGTSMVSANGVGYALLAVVLFTLKDAAARGRLGASTFKALNIGECCAAALTPLRCCCRRRRRRCSAASDADGLGSSNGGQLAHIVYPHLARQMLHAGTAVMALAMGLSLAGWVQAGAVASTKLVIAKIAASALLASVALYNYAFAKKKK